MNTDRRMILVVGATGSIGSLVVEEALRQGTPSVPWFATAPRQASSRRKRK
jgi:uncharacterized protein YbjT (DUF2867 family)